MTHPTTEQRELLVDSDPCVTKEGIRVEVGQVWQDLDKRMTHRRLEITRVSDGFAYFEKPRKGRVSISRMHKHATGFSLVAAAIAKGEK